MIEESGENWHLYTDIEHPHSITVLTTRTSVERTETINKPGKRKKPKTRPFGFAQALPKKKGKR